MLKSPRLAEDWPNGLFSPDNAFLLEPKFKNSHDSFAKSFVNDNICLFTFVAKDPILPIAPATDIAFPTNPPMMPAKSLISDFNWDRLIGNFCIFRFSLLISSGMSLNIGGSCAVAAKASLNVCSVLITFDTSSLYCLSWFEALLVSLAV